MTLNKTVCSTLELKQCETESYEVIYVPQDVRSGKPDTEQTYTISTHLQVQVLAIFHMTTNSTQKQSFHSVLQQPKQTTVYTD